MSDWDAIIKESGRAIWAAKVDDLQRQTQAPVGLIVGSVLSAISTAVQPLFDVERPTGQKGPVSLYLIMAAKSGERKTTVDDNVMRSVWEFDQKQYALHADSVRQWTSNFEIWDVKRRALKKASSDSYKKSALKGRSGGDGFDDVLREHLNNEPQPPKLFRSLYSNVTIEALWDCLHKNTPNAALISNEGSDLLKSVLSQNMESLTTAWGGGRVVVDRKTVPSFSVKDPRLTVSLMVQPKLLQGYLDREGDTARNIGLLARFLAFDVGTTQGTRFLREEEGNGEADCSFDRRLWDLLENGRAFMAGGGIRQVLRFAPAARQRWLSAFNEVEAGISPGGKYEEAGDHASKLAENYARLAACLHVFEGKHGDISEETLGVAIEICNNCSNDFMRLFLKPPMEICDANVLEEWLRGQINGCSGGIILRNRILQYGPGKIRSVKRLDAAISVLTARGLVRETVRGRTKVLDLRGLISLDSVAERIDSHNAMMRRMQSIASRRERR